MTDRPEIRPEAMEEFLSHDAFQYAFRTLRDRYLKDMVEADDESVIGCRNRVRALDDLMSDLRRMAKEPSTPTTRI